MSIIYILLLLSLGVAIVFFILFILSVRKGQYEDTYTPSVRMLFDDELIEKEDTSEKNSKNNSIETNLTKTE